MTQLTDDGLNLINGILDMRHHVVCRMQSLGRIDHELFRIRGVQFNPLHENKLVYYLETVDPKGQGYWETSIASEVFTVPEAKEILTDLLRILNKDERLLTNIVREAGWAIQANIDALEKVIAQWEGMQE
jgi:hypothetical protein